MTAETVGADPTDPTSSALAHFGAEVRLEREALGLSRADFGKEATCGYDLVAKIEKGQRVPPREFAEACDRVFPHANGRFLRLWPLALKFAYPAWFRGYVELEEKATHIRLFHPLLVPGLVQTEEYAREVLRAGRPENLDDAVTIRMERQRVLVKDDPPRLWLVLSEYVLRRTSVGDAAVMRGQLQRLRDLAETPRHILQILPEEAGPVHGGSNPFGVLSFREGADVVHVDGFPTGYIVADTAPVSEAQNAYDLLKATALPPDKSAALIDEIMKDVHA
ncbi:helix-turn-helix domain-containing protein [Streptomyces sp. H27-D2]|uniref:helix-turn-helix domain-containing protein n=1 Tax=Streptomyces sp. H27-D2 TaxID=3046304 RepID=UPI002DB594E0|nr:helix-turn-helix transcriptional regulator [Streptomyces sp. H27-D2]MEC4018646.1 helix-turn-helix transcriptional regulator [Streptomyces sp. H27-D2]